MTSRISKSANKLRLSLILICTLPTTVRSADIVPERVRPEPILEVRSSGTSVATDLVREVVSKRRAAIEAQDAQLALLQSELAQAEYAHHGLWLVAVPAVLVGVFLTAKAGYNLYSAWNLAGPELAKLGPETRTALYNVFAHPEVETVGLSVGAEGLRWRLLMASIGDALKAAGIFYGTHFVLNLTESQKQILEKRVNLARVHLAGLKKELAQIETAQLR